MASEALGDRTNSARTTGNEPGSNGFIRVVLRGLARERKLGDIGAQPPFRLTRFSNGQITLTDTSSGKQIDLDAFGSSNTQAFARLMNVRSAK